MNQSARCAVLLVNLGTPAAPSRPALRAYLKQFLSDPRVVEIPRPIWWLILNGIILNTRPAKSAEKYAKIWTADGSPLLVHTRNQATLLQEKMGERAIVDYAMRYGSPSIAEKLDQLQRSGCDRILFLPLYPQYAASSTATAFDALFDEIGKLRNPPELRLVKQFHDDPGYIRALAGKISRFWEQNGKCDRLVMSFHGIPKKSVDLGDPYQAQCLETGRLLGAALQLDESEYAISFQSRFGAAEWLKPYTVDVIRELAPTAPRVDVVCPGFPADCLETLEEIAMEVKTEFAAAGGGQFRYIPALNEDPSWIDALEQIAANHLSGWIR